MNRVQNRVQKVNNRVKDGRKKIQIQMKKTAKKMKKRMTIRKQNSHASNGERRDGEREEDEDDDSKMNSKRSTAYYFSLGQWVPRERLLSLTLQASKPPIIHVAGACPACAAAAATAVSSSASSSSSLSSSLLKTYSNEKLASTCSDVLCQLLRSYVSRRIGIQILSRLSIPLEVELCNFNALHPQNKAVLKLLMSTPKSSKSKRKRLLKKRSSHKNQQKNKTNSRSNTNSNRRKEYKPDENVMFSGEEEEEEEEEGTIAEEHECPICVDLLCNPCILKCEHIFCKLCLLKVAVTRFEKLLSPLCPLCRDPFVLNDIVVDETVSKELKELYNDNNSSNINNNSSSNTTTTTNNNNNSSSSNNNTNLSNADSKDHELGMYDERLEETMEMEMTIVDELNQMMMDRNVTDRVGSGINQVETTTDGPSTVLEGVMAIAVFMLTVIGHYTTNTGVMWLRLVLILCCSMLMTLYFLFFANNGNGKGVLLMVTCFQWGCVAIEVGRVMTSV